MNGDGNLDAVVTNWYYNSSTNSYGSVGILLGNGNGTFRPVVAYSSVVATPESVVVGDFNGDGQLDVAVASGAAQGTATATPGLVAVLLNSGNGTFKTPVMKYSTGGRNANSIAMGNLNPDKVPDLVVADSCDGYNDTCDLGGGVAVLLGLPAGTTTTVKTSLTPSKLGQSVTFTATITATDGPIPNGTVIKFFNGPTQIGSSTTTNGAAKFTTSGLAVGTHTIRASYAGGAFFKASSGTLTQVVVN